MKNLQSIIWAAQTYLKQRQEYIRDFKIVMESLHLSPFYADMQMLNDYPARYWWCKHGVEYNEQRAQSMIEYYNETLSDIVANNL